ncbi:polysaccharide pyruvyl transferase family protein [Winslowiella iniecta]|uniref:Exosortase n=1 Tax=Winslowiella iniecta TaxID=1560201 RepID=A0A0L7T1P6_9GAMM|nr:polysaccharide pyruvyl transferase family protein [Winslowiella iniecta]KOC89220.1 exosortase [Winslowiella iniecta]KOC92142.1 exosortase [Winslowiella iniecta]
MKVHYFKAPEGNFGDDLNDWLWQDLLPGVFDNDESFRFAGIGTIISANLPAAKNWVVFSSGVGYGIPPANFGDASWNILSVRGPLSAHVLGLPKEKAITDGAALLSTLAEFPVVPESERKGIIFIPHHDALKTGQWEEVCRRAGVEYVSPQGDAKEIINKIRHAKLILADAMHAAIIADAMRVPWVPLVSSDQINTFKWLDWTQTINERYQPLVLGSSSFREAMRNKSLGLYGEKYYQKDATVDSAIERFIRVRKQKSSSWWPTYLKYSRYLSHVLPNKIFTGVETGMNLRWNESYLEQAAEKLRQASLSSGQLSDDTIFNDNVSKLLERLRQVELIAMAQK